MELKQNVMYKVVKGHKDSAVKKGESFLIKEDGYLYNWSRAERIVFPDMINAYFDRVDVEIDFEYAKNEIRKHQNEIDSIVERYGIILSDD